MVVKRVIALVIVLSVKCSVRCRLLLSMRWRPTRLKLGSPVGLRFPLVCYPAQVLLVVGYNVFCRKLQRNYLRAPLLDSRYFITRLVQLSASIRCTQACSTVVVLLWNPLAIRSLCRTELLGPPI